MTPFATTRFVIWKALSSHHVEEKVIDGDRSRFLVRIAEQEYVAGTSPKSPTLMNT
jgi:hypothetical protein